VSARTAAAIAGKSCAKSLAGTTMLAAPLACVASGYTAKA
jgi:hypothetical protein